MLKVDTEERKEEGWPNPYPAANVFSKLLFWWMFPFLRYGYKHTLEITDMFTLINDDSTEILTTKLAREWERELEKSKQSNKHPSLGKAIFRVFRLPMFIFGLIVTLEECVFKMAQPVLLAYLVQYFGDHPGITKQQAYMCAGGIGLCSVMMSITHHISWFVFSRVGMQIRVGVSALVYKKALCLGNTAFKITTVGQIVNLLTNDVNRFDRVTMFIHYLWIAPIQVLTMLALLWMQMGPLALIAVCTLLLLVPLQAFMAKMFSTLRAKTAVLTDERVRIMNEIISGMRVIKVHGWEEPFTNLVNNARRYEFRFFCSYALACFLC